MQIHLIAEVLLKETKMNDLLTISEVARILRVDDTTVRRWIKQGALEAIVLPHVNERQGYRVRRSTLEQLVGSPIKLQEVESK
jgi:excisionase family DNA binding protein